MPRGSTAQNYCRSDYDDHPSRRFLFGSPLVGLLERLLVPRVATGPGLTAGSCRGVPRSALVQGLLPICGGELNFKLMDLIPLGVSALALRYRQQLLQATAGGHLLWCIHADIIPSFGRCIPAGAKPSAAHRRSSSQSFCSCRAMQYRVTWSAALYAGVAAGILATLVQIALWSIFADVLPTILFRDARFTAAIVMGRAVLPAPATFDGGIMLVATLVHFALSIIYGLSLSWVIVRLRAAPSLLVGALFGLAVYGMNMYGFTAVFPWFEAPATG